MIKKVDLLEKLYDLRVQISGETQWHLGRLVEICKIQDWAKSLPDDPATPSEPDQLRFVSFTSVLVPAGPNNGDYVLHTALDREGRLWQSYDSAGYSNVPTDGLWRLVPLSVYQDAEVTP